MNKGQARILVAEDEPRYIRAIKLNLENSGYEVLTASNGEAAVELAISETPDLVLLDVRMPKMNGYQACQRIREFSTVPIIMLTAMAEEADKVKGLDAGADDYVTKPFSAEELLARVRAALRRSHFAELAETQVAFQLADLRIDFAQQRIFVADNEINLTSTEYRLLCELARQAGQLPPEYLLEKVWGSGYEGEIQLVWQAIHRLRQKIEADPHDPHYIQNRPGIGYLLSLSSD